LSSATDAVVTPLPYIEPGNTEGSLGAYITFRAVEGGVIIISNVNPGTGTDGNNNVVFQYRYVLVPGGVAARSALNWKNYQDVAKFLGWKD
jgi:hypothetical protein